MNRLRLLSRVKRDPAIGLGLVPVDPQAGVDRQIRQRAVAILDIEADVVLFRRPLQRIGERMLKRDDAAGPNALVDRGGALAVWAAEAITRCRDRQRTKIIKASLLLIELVVVVLLREFDTYL